MEKRRPWYLGNTTLRNPYRLRDGLDILVGSFFHGNLQGKENEQEFAKLLDEKGVVSIARLSNGPSTDVSDVGRKWRSALSQLGFLIHEKAEDLDSKYINQSYRITENGKRLLQAETTSGIQECFLRSLLAYQIPSGIETGYKYEQFSPLFHVLKIMKKMEELTGSSRVTMKELGFFIQLSSSSDNVDDIANRILEYRENKKASESKKKFDRELKEKIGNEESTVQPSTLSDYADTNFRYLKATGLFESKGKGIVFDSSKAKTIEYILSNYRLAESDEDYLITLFKGANLPTDNLDTVKEVIDDLSKQLAEAGVALEKDGVEATDVKSLNLERYKLEEKILSLKEEEFAEIQKNYWEEIIVCMDELIENKRKCVFPTLGEDIHIGTDERPAYFERVMWRAFLAINNLVIPASECRRFRIDKDLLPISHASGGDADCIFEFEDYRLVLEVTLTQSSRQEAAEGEPVRRHVAKHVEENEKDVYGLFLANKVDTNTIETFRHGVRYDKQDEKLDLSIVPMTLEVFRNYFYRLFSENIAKKNIDLVDRFKNSLAEKNTVDAPTWRTTIISNMK